jgi:hypothetical protein
LDPVTLLTGKDDEAGRLELSPGSTLADELPP